MAPSLLAPGVSDEILNSKSNAKKVIGTEPKSNCNYTTDEKTYKQGLESSFKVGTSVSFLRPEVLSGCINLVQQAHEDYHTIDPVLRKKVFGTDKELSLDKFVKMRSTMTNWDDPMAKCDLGKIVNDDSLKDVLNSCNVCPGTETGNYKFSNIMSCYSNVNKLSIAKMELNNNS